jgi:RNA polymerase sigma-70 factor (ECF subfamily)
MTDRGRHFELVKQAQLGDQDSAAHLAKLAGQIVRAYVFRLTMDTDLAEDLSQETLLEMVRFIKKLRFEHAGQFWGWLYRTALSKVQLHSRNRRHQRKMQKMATSDREQLLLERVSESYGDGLRNLISKELSEAIVDAMGELKLRHRNILVLRCCEQLPYSEIADIMGCSELAAQVLFFRAKQALKRRLSQRGFGKGMLAIAMAMFALLTGPAEASSAAVTAASTKVGFTATVLGAAGTKLGAAILIAAATLISGAVALLNAPRHPEIPIIPPVYSNDKIPQPSKVKSIRYVCGDARSGHFYHYYHDYCFPDGIDGPMLMRTEQWDQSRRHKLASFLGDAQKNYVYCCDPRCPIHSCKTVCIRNRNVYDSTLEITRMPFDPPELTAFLNLIEGEEPAFEYVNVSYNTLDETHFQPDWPVDAPVIDERDAMHIRGWTYFRIEGQIDNEQIHGWGCIPFTYDASREHPAWLRLKAGERLQIIDTASGAYLVTADPSATPVYPSGTFFKGLPRPWMGLHTIDIVRRDAAECRIEFDTQKTKDEKVEVALLEGTGYWQPWATYVIDMERDIVETIEFLTSGDARQERKGRLRFTYLEDVEQAAAEFIEPGEMEVSPQTQQEPMGISWLMELARGTLANEPKTR